MRRGASLDDRSEERRRAAQYVLFALNQTRTDRQHRWRRAEDDRCRHPEGFGRAVAAGGRRAGARRRRRTSKARADWEAALKAAETVDAIAPSAQSASTSACRRSRSRPTSSPRRPDAREEHQGGRQGAGVHARRSSAEDLLAKDVDRHAARRDRSTRTSPRRSSTTSASLGDFVGSVKKHSASRRSANVRTQPVACATGCVVSSYSASPGSRATCTHRSRARARYMSLFELEYLAIDVHRDRLGRFDRHRSQLHVVHAVVARRARRA